MGSSSSKPTTDENDQLGEEITFTDIYDATKEDPGKMGKYGGFILSRVKKLASDSLELIGTKNPSDDVEKLRMLAMEIKERLSPFAPNGIGCTGLDLLQYAVQDDISYWSKDDYKIFAEYYACGVLGITKDIDEDGKVEWVLTQARAEQIVDFARRAEQFGVGKDINTVEKKKSTANSDNTEKDNQDKDDSEDSNIKLLSLSMIDSDTKDVGDLTYQERQVEQWENDSNSSASREVDDVMFMYS